MIPADDLVEYNNDPFSWINLKNWKFSHHVLGIKLPASWLTCLTFKKKVDRLTCQLHKKIMSSKMRKSYLYTLYNIHVLTLGWDKNSCCKIFTKKIICRRRRKKSSWHQVFPSFIPLKLWITYSFLYQIWFEVMEGHSDGRDSDINATLLLCLFQNKKDQVTHNSLSYFNSKRSYQY